MARIIGLDRVTARLVALAGPAKRPLIYKALYAAGNRIEIAAEISITAGSISGKDHVASSPGEAPNADTRLLDSSIETTGSPTDLRVEISSNAPYSAALEYGTSKMAARPFMRPAAIKERGAAAELVAKAVRSVIRRPG